jgi:Na+-transporting NADH:ubiquinone oxidoreductase subunit C
VEHSSRHTVIFTTILCVVFSLIVSSVSVAHTDRQVDNTRLDKMKNVLAVAGLIQSGETPSREELSRRFETKLEPHLIEIETGSYVDVDDPMAYDQRKASTDPARSTVAPENLAKVRRIPNHAQIFLLREDGEINGIILPIEGYGLWSTLYGFVALEPDAQTIRGITYYQHGETAGLGGEVDNPRWKALWPGRLVYDDSGEVAIRVNKGRAGAVEDDPYRVDGLSGATLTSNGVTNMLHFWLGENGFASYLDRYRRDTGI